MKILLDECLPKKLKKHFQGHEIYTVPEMGWGGTKNGALLKLAAGKFELFVTIDQNLQYQQNLSQPPLAIIVLKALNNRYQTLLPLAPKIMNAIGTIQPNQIVYVS